MTDLDNLSIDSNILVSKYESVNTDLVAQAQHHLSKSQCQELATLLRKFTKLFSGKLGLYPYRKVHLELLPNTMPSHKQPYLVPLSQWDLFKQELNCLVDAGVLSPCSASKWAAPTFLVPDKSVAFAVLESNCESHMDSNLVMEPDRNNVKTEVTMVIETCQVTVDGGGPAGETIYDWEYLRVWSTIMEE